MTKLKFEDILNLYTERKQGKTVLFLCSKYNISDTRVEYLTRLIDKHGFEILMNNKKKYYPLYEKEQIINRVLVNEESLTSVALDEGLSSSGILNNWVKKYKENGYNIVERKRGRSPTMSNKRNKPNKNETIEEENERLKKENLYLKAELEYSKKLRAVVQARKNQQQKKK